MKWDSSKVKQGFEFLEKRRLQAVKMYAQTGSVLFENYAKTNRRWTDRTGHARQRLKGSVEMLNDSYIARIKIAHGVFYGIYLENCHEKRYAILEETVEHNKNAILEGFRYLF